METRENLSNKPKWKEDLNRLDFLADAELHAGNVQVAKAFYEHALVILVRHYGPGHLAVAKVLNKLGCAARELGKEKEARSLHARALSIEERHYGAENAQLANTMVWLASAEGAAG